MHVNSEPLLPLLDIRLGLDSVGVDDEVDHDVFGPAVAIDPFTGPVDLMCPLLFVLPLATKSSGKVVASVVIDSRTVIDLFLSPWISAQMEPLPLLAQVRMPLG
jgi:hypothetical protein